MYVFVEALDTRDFRHEMSFVLEWNTEDQPIKLRNPIPASIATLIFFLFRASSLRCFFASTETFLENFIQIILYATSFCVDTTTF